MKSQNEMFSLSQADTLNTVFTSENEKIVQLSFCVHFTVAPELMEHYKTDMDDQTPETLFEGSEDQPAALTFVTESKYEDEDDERERRIRLYEKQWEEYVAKHGASEFQNDRPGWGAVGWAVKCIDTGEVFELARKAAEWLGVTKSAINHACVSGSPCKGHRFERIGEARTFTRRNSRPVRCVETGEEYPSITAASKVTNIPLSSLFDSVKHGKAPGGMTFEYADKNPVSRSCEHQEESRYDSDDIR